MVGIPCFAMLYLLFDLLGRSIGVPVLIQLDEPILISRYGDDSLEDSVTTTFGYCVIAISAMLASRVGMAIRSGTLKGGVSAQGEIEFFAWLIGIIMLSICSALLFLAFRHTRNELAHFLRIALELGAIIWIAWTMKAWRDKRAGTSR